MSVPMVYGMPATEALKHYRRAARRDRLWAFRAGLRIAFWELVRACTTRHFFYRYGVNRWIDAQDEAEHAWYGLEEDQQNEWRAYRALHPESDPVHLCDDFCALAGCPNVGTDN